MGTGPLDSEILINSGIPLSMSDLSYHLPTGAYSLDNTLASQKDYCASFSTTRLLQLLPSIFDRNGTSLGIMLYPGKSDGFGRNSLVGVISGKPLNYDNFYDSILTNEQLLALPENKEWKDFSFCTGSIIGSVEIIDCVQNHPSIWAEKGVYNWVLANPILYENPIKDVKGKLSFWDYPGIKEVKIECPECGSIEIAVEDYTTAPFPTYLHRCNKCEHVIIESEWKEVKL